MRNPSAAGSITTKLSTSVHSSVASPRPPVNGTSTLDPASRAAAGLAPDDRTTAFLFGDGAGAVVVGPSDTPGIGPTVWGSDGSKADAVGINHTLNEFRNGTAPWPTLRQEGPTVFRWAVWEMVKVARQAL